ncbi:hypothetical protein BRADI_3g24142v3 [Brachypodium distachyon]|uniref:Uncharacterized protein n=1 Tax=Brachypodium distachyon TaxID=15368 RepID=A0A0Q3Q4G3_BRADI|nr:hypothetical protein BRADI_3g24142v3 [Brachypodium distachyon]
MRELNSIGTLKGKEENKGEAYTASTSRQRHPWIQGFWRKGRADAERPGNGAAAGNLAFHWKARRLGLAPSIARISRCSPGGRRAPRHQLRSMIGTEKIWRGEAQRMQQPRSP